MTEEQRRQAGCSADRMQRGFHHGLLGGRRAIVANWASDPNDKIEFACIDPLSPVTLRDWRHPTDL